jgi:transposase, IS5 family
MKQQTLAMAADKNAQFKQNRRPTKRDVFLGTMEQVVPCAELCPVIEPHYPKAANGRPPTGLKRMLRVYLVQHWFHLADAACEDALLDSTVLHRFVGIDLERERVPDATTLLKFRRLLERHELGEALFVQVGAVSQAHGLKVGTSTIVDATIIGAPSWTKNSDNQRDPEMHQTRSVPAALERLVNCTKSRVRARIGQVLAVVKRLWGFNKVHYRGLVKSATRAFVSTVLANLFLARKRHVA